MNNTPTPRTDERKASFASDTIRQLETKLAAVTKQLKETKKHLKDANRGAEINAHALRINAEKLTAVTEQRDRLAEAMEDIAYQKLSDELDDYTYEHANWEGSWDYIINIARKALQSLNPDHTVDANDMIPAVKGGNHES